ncbi:MAG: hypothetical protein PUK18_01975 [Firmicutes bacterium]|nr:hypothetical protein [Bacillota bacterium]MDY6159521.1 hypothetical protein [Candidatus Faecousia sp.]
MPKNTNPPKKRDALKGACFYTLLCLAGPGMLLYLRRWYFPEGFLSALLLIVSLLDLGLIIPIWISFKERIKEIEGGEEDAAAEY